MYELIAPKLERGETTEYKWVAEIYTYYVKNLIGSSPEEELADRYYRKTIEAVGKALRMVEKEAEFSPISIDRSFFEKFIESREVSIEEKASTLLLGLTRFALFTAGTTQYTSPYRTRLRKFSRHGRGSLKQVWSSTRKPRVSGGKYMV